MSNLESWDELTSYVKAHLKAKSDKEQRKKVVKR